MNAHPGYLRTARKSEAHWYGAFSFEDYDDSVLKKTERVRRAPMRKTIVAASSVALIAALAGCSLLDGPTPKRPDRPVVQVPDEAAAYVPDGSAEDNLPIFLQTLQAAAGQEGPFESKALAERFIDVGFLVESMQVSQDRTRTDLEPESMFISARFGAECLVGQIVSADRSIEAEVVPAVGPQGNLCLIGQTIPLTGE